MVRGGNTKAGRAIRKRFRNVVGDESDRPTAKWKEKGERRKMGGRESER